MKKMKKILYILSSSSLGLLLTACIPEEKIEPVPQAPNIQALSASDAIKMQSPEQLKYQLLNPKNLPEKRNIHYFDKLKRPEVRPMKNGFYREIIGKTPDGRAVVQDFYQNNDTPFTSPYIAIKDAKLRLFDDKSAIDSRVAWFYPDGKIQLIADYQAGKPTGEFWIFQNSSHSNNQNNQLLSAYILDKNINPDNPDNNQENQEIKEIKMQFFYPNGDLMAERITRQQKNSKIMFYYQGGAAMLQIDDTPQQSTRLAWNQQGKTVAPNDIMNDLNFVQKFIQDNLKLIKKEQDMMNFLIK